MDNFPSDYSSTNRSSSISRTATGQAEYRCKKKVRVQSWIAQGTKLLPIKRIQFTLSSNASFPFPAEHVVQLLSSKLLKLIDGKTFRSETHGNHKDVIYLGETVNYTRVLSYLANMLNTWAKHINYYLCSCSLIDGRGLVLTQRF